MTTHAPPQADADYLTSVLRKSGDLHSGRVSAARVVHTIPTILSMLHRLKLDYEGEAGPRHLYLKTGKPDSKGAGWEAGPREVAFYATVAPHTPAGLLPRCYSAEAAKEGAWHLLLEDLTDTHALPSEPPLPPTVAQMEAIVRCRARFQAAWWDNPRLGAGVGHRPSDDEMAQWRDWQEKAYGKFADALGERLSADRRAVYDKLLAEATRLSQRFRSWRHMTIIQGDGHVWNCFLPKDGNDTPRWFDWDGWRVAVGAEDLAYMIAMFWFPEMRRRAERPLLDAFHEELEAHGVKGYDRQALQEDYRLSVLWQIMRPVWMHSFGLPPGLWWNHVERIHLAVDDLGCRELLG